MQGTQALKVQAQAVAGARTRFALGPSLAVVGDARLPTYTCPKPPLPSFRSTM